MCQSFAMLCTVRQEHQLELDTSFQPKGPNRVKQHNDMFVEGPPLRCHAASFQNAPNVPAFFASNMNANKILGRPVGFKDLSEFLLDVPVFSVQQRQAISTPDPARSRLAGGVLQRWQTLGFTLWSRS